MEHIDELIKLGGELQRVEHKIKEGMSYGASRDIRKVCQKIKEHAQALRQEVNELRKK